MILFAIIGESLDVIYASTVIGMIIVCWAMRYHWRQKKSTKEKEII